MTTEWKTLSTLKEVAEAQHGGWEIERLSGGAWLAWNQTCWSNDYMYRGRPARPKMKKVVSECWRCPKDGRLVWGDSTCDAHNQGWQRFPAGDIEGEV